MRWQEVTYAYEREHDTITDLKSCAGDPSGGQQPRQPRGHHAHCAIGQPFFATRCDGHPGAAPGRLAVTTPFKRGDMPYVIGTAVVVIAIIVVMKLWLG
jgi:hypothetical protein